MNPQFIAEVRRQVDALLEACPELKADDKLRADMFEAETKLHDVLRILYAEWLVADAKANGMNDALLAMQLRQSRMESNAEKIEAVMHRLMDYAGVRKVELPEATLYLAQYGPKPMKPETVDGLPEEFIRTTTTREPNMKAIAAAYKEGRTVPGIQLSNGKATFTIRT